MKRTGWMMAATLMAVVALAPSTWAGQGPEEAVDRLFSAYREGSVEGMLSAYATNATFEDINQRHHFTGTEHLRAMLTAIVGMHLQMDLEEERRVVDGDMVVVEYEYRGQLNGAALGASVGKHGCPDLEYALPATSWYEVKDGKIINQKDFIDWATFLELRQTLLEQGTAAAVGEK